MERLHERPTRDLESLRRLEGILDRTYDDLGIDAASPFARRARKVIAALRVQPRQQGAPLQRPLARH